MLKPEAGAQEPAWIVRHALQLGLVGDAAFSLLAGFRRLRWRGVCLARLIFLLAQGFLNALALGGIGGGLLLRILGLWGLLGLLRLPRR